MLASRILPGPRTPDWGSRDFGFVVRLAERVLESAVAYRARESKRAQRQRLRVERAAVFASVKGQRAIEAEARDRRKKIRLRLSLEKNMTIEEIMRSQHQR